MLSYLAHDLFLGKPAVPRSPEWPTVEKNHLKLHPACLVTGETKDVEVHHVLPFHLFPQYELFEWNLRTVIRDIHFIFGHCRNWSHFNPHFDSDVLSANHMFQWALSSVPNDPHFDEIVKQLQNGFTVS